MKIQIRKGVFETNSSSTHALCIGKGYNKKLVPEFINFGTINNREFWTCKHDYQYRADKLFAGIINKDNYNGEQSFIRFGMLIEMLKKLNISYDFNLTRDYIENNLPYVEECDWVDTVLESEENFLCYLFNDDSDFHIMDLDQLYNIGGWDNIFDKNKVNIYAED